MATIRGRARSAKRASRRAGRARPVVRIGRPDAALTGLAGLVAVDKLAARLGIVAELDRGVGSEKQRDRGASAGQLLVGMASGYWSGRTAWPGWTGSAPMRAAGCWCRHRCRHPRRPAWLARRFTPAALAGIEAGLAKVYQRWLALVPAAVRVPLVLRHPTIDCDATDIEVYGSNKQRAGWNYAGVKCGRVHLPAGRRPSCPWRWTCSRATTMSVPTLPTQCAGPCRCCQARSAAGRGCGPTPGTRLVNESTHVTAASTRVRAPIACASSWADSRPPAGRKDAPAPRPLRCHGRSVAE